MSMKIDYGVTSILTSVLNLCMLKVPVVVAFHYRGKTQQFGTKFAREQLQQYTAEINGALERDALCLCLCKYKHGYDRQRAGTRLPRAVPQPWFQF